MLSGKRWNAHRLTLEQAHPLMDGLQIRRQEGNGFGFPDPLYISGTIGPWSCAIEQLRAVVPDTPHILADFLCLHFFSWERFQPFQGRLLPVLPGQPSVIVLGLDNEWHSVVNRGSKFVWICRDDAEALKPSAVRVPPSVP